MPAFPTASDITELHITCVQRWHVHPIECVEEGVLNLVCQQHASNFQLWHQEDLARTPAATDTEIANVKRAIDSLNQQRNDQIEAIDDSLARLLCDMGVTLEKNATRNTETVGSVIDRLSIMSLRLYHYREQLDRDAGDTHADRVQRRIQRCQQQHVDLSGSLQELLDDLFAGRKQHKTYRQMKMYNDPSLNPAIYQSNRGQSNSPDETIGKSDVQGD